MDWPQHSDRQLQQFQHNLESVAPYVHTLNSSSCGTVAFPAIKGCKSLLPAHDLSRLDPLVINRKSYHQEPFNSLKTNDHRQQCNGLTTQLTQRHELLHWPHHNHLNNVLAACMQGANIPLATARPIMFNHVLSSMSSRSSVLQSRGPDENMVLDGDPDSNIIMQPGGNIRISENKRDQCHPAYAGPELRFVKDSARSRSISCVQSHGATANSTSKVAAATHADEVILSNGAAAGHSPTTIGGPQPVTPHNDSLSLSVDAKVSSSWLSSGGSQDLSVEEKEMLYRAAAMQPISDVNPTCSSASADTEVDKPKARRNVRISKDPQSVAARQRRQRISSKMRVLQRLVPGGMKMDTASMLEEAAHYLKFLKTEVEKMEAIEQLMNVAKGHFDSKRSQAVPQIMHGPQSQTISKSVPALTAHPGMSVVTPAGTTSAAPQSSLLSNYLPASAQPPPHNSLYLNQASVSF